MYLFPDTHAVIQFLDKDATAIVPIRRLKKQKHGAYVLLHGATKSSSIKPALYIVCNYNIYCN